MRILSILFLCLSVFAFSSCGGDDDGPSITLTEADVAGTWTVDRLDTDAERLVLDAGTTVTTSASAGDITITFATGGTWTSAGEFTNNEVTILTNVDNTENGIGSGTYRVSGDKIFLSGMQLYNGSTPTVTELEFFAKSFTAGTELRLEASPNDIVRLLGSESGSKADIKFDLSM